MLIDAIDFSPAGGPAGTLTYRNRPSVNQNLICWRLRVEKPLRSAVADFVLHLSAMRGCACAAATWLKLAAAVFESLCSFSRRQQGAMVVVEEDQRSAASVLICKHRSGRRAQSIRVSLNGKDPGPQQRGDSVDAGCPSVDAGCPTSTAGLVHTSIHQSDSLISGFLCSRRNREGRRWKSPSPGFRTSSISSTVDRGQEGGREVKDTWA